MPASRKRLTGAIALAVVTSGLLLVPSTSAQANPAGTGLVINEVYGAGGNTNAVLNADYVELYNPTAAPISLDGMYLHYRSLAGNYGGVAALPTAGSVPANSTYLVQTTAATVVGAPLPTPDYVTPSNLNIAASGGQVFLALTGTQFPATVTGDVNGTPGVVDMVGVMDSTAFEGAAATVVAAPAKSISRAPGGVDTDSNAADFVRTDPNPTPSTAVATPLEATDPGDQSGSVGMAVSSFTLQASGGTPPYSWAVEGLPDGVTATADGLVAGTPTTVGTYPVTATVVDEVDATSTVEFTFTVTEAPDLTPIAEIQGTGAASPLDGDDVVTQGVVTGIYRDPYPTELGTYGGLDGMYVETPGTDTDGASDAVFVYGANATPDGVAVGDSVEVAGEVDEFNTMTQILTADGSVTELDTPLGTVTPRDIAYPTTEAAREAREGELIAPTDSFTVTNSYSTNQYGEIGLATGDTPLMQPTELYADDDTANLDAVKADNAARGVVLDDGTSINYLSNNQPQQDLPLPWLSADHPVRVGAEATLLEPVILEYRNNHWNFQPTAPVLDLGEDVVDIEDTRVGNEAPQEVGGDLQIATFNVLNFFNTTGEQYVANGAAQNPAVNTQCTYYTDRDNNPIGNNRCGVVTNGVNAGNGPRGAATQASLERQRDKIVTAINAMDADIIGLEEIENSMKLVGETNRDDAVAYLVNALNADAGAGTWRFVHSPAEALTTAAVGEQDVIRPAFIYRAAEVQPVGQSDILFGTTEFANAREPLAQAFKPKGALDSDAFAVIVNHFKSKGDSDPAAGGDNANNPDTGAFNGDRTRQATKLAEFASDFAEARGIDAVFLAGDFNSYSMEDPMQVLYDSGYTAIESDTEGEETYSYSGLSGSLDHVLGNDAAMDMVTGADIWDINAAESVAYQYSRFNYNVRQLFDASNPFAASDHNPEIVGIDVPDFGTDYTPVQIVATNDFHGRLLADGANAAGAAILSGAVKELRSDNPDTVFAAAGDLIGASTFESFIQHDEPTIDALNEAGLEVSAAGNHEFDAGYEDLVGRVQDRADWEYIAANVEEPEGRDDLAETWTKTFGTGDDAIEVGFVGAVTEDLPSLVSPAGIEGVTVTDIVDATNAAAADLRDGGADLVVLLVHEGSPSTDCATMTDDETTWGHIVTGVSSDVDAIVSGHTHLAYNCSFPVQDWVDEGRSVTDRPVVSAGQYGTFLNQLVFTFDNATGELVTTSQDVIGLVGTGYPADPATKAIVDAAVAEAEVLGAQELGQIGGAFNRAKLANGTTENRGGESSLGNLVAEVQRWATETPEAGSAQIAFMNPGGLRADMVGFGTGAFPRTLTYKQAAVVQPFANTLVNMNLTGADIKLVLEQQWQRDGSGNVPSRPFLRLGTSKGFTYTYDPALPEGSRITGMWLDGEPIEAADTLSVTVNSFLASGGDNFRAFTNGTNKRDTGKVDLQAMVDYMDEFASDGALPVDYAQHAVGVSFPGGAPETYEPGGTVAFSLSSLAMTAPGDVQDTEVSVSVGEEELGTFTVDNTNGTDVFDEYGKASVEVTLPDDLGSGPVDLVVRGAATGTEVLVPITVEGGTTETVPTTTSATAESMTWGTPGEVEVTVTPATAAGDVTISEGATEVASGTIVGGAGTVTIGGKALDPGSHTLTVQYAGDAGHDPSSTTVTVQVAKAKPTVKVAHTPKKVKVGAKNVRLTVSVRADGFTPTGFVTVRVPGQGSTRVRLAGGKATLRLDRMKQPGKKVVTVVYAGDDTTKSATVKHTITVKRR